LGGIRQPLTFYGIRAEIGVQGGMYKVFRGKTLGRDLTLFRPIYINVKLLPVTQSLQILSD